MAVLKIIMITHSLSVFWSCSILSGACPLQECMAGNSVAVVNSNKRILRAIKVLRILKIMRLLKGIKLVE
jgi:hypothetical protein